MALTLPTRYVTLNGEPPNGGLVQGRLLYEVEENLPPSPGLPPYQEATGVTCGNHGSNAILNQSSATGAQPTAASMPILPFPYIVQYNNFAPAPALAPTLAAALAPAPAPAMGSVLSDDVVNLRAGQANNDTHMPQTHNAPSANNAHEQPNNLMQRRSEDGYFYFFPKSYAVLNFLFEGQRPCDSLVPWRQSFGIEKIRAPCAMPMWELLWSLLSRSQQATGRRARGVQEMHVDSNSCFHSRRAYIEGGPSHYHTLEQVGWGSSRGEGNPIYLVLVF